MALSVMGVAKTVSLSAAFFFAVGAVTGPAGMAVASTYAGTIGTGVANTAHGGVEAVKWTYEAAAPLFGVE